jgi:hypothetical protein
VVGDVLGRFHTHGDASVYMALVRMAQPFSMGLMLVDGQGNFGSVDGDMPASMRYTECRMAPAATALMADIDKDTVDFQPNYDEKELEPVVLPSRIPNLLVNGAGGIAVGMATNIPPHNLSECIDGICAQIAAGGKGIGRAAIEEDGKVLIYVGLSGGEVASADGQPADATSSHAGIVAMLEALFVQSKPAEKAASAANESQQAEPQEPEQQEGEPELGPFGPILTQYRHDAQGAIAALMALRDGEAVAALQHPEVGDIDLVWGAEGDPEKGFKGGYGLAKIAAKHPEVLGSLQDLVASAVVKERDDTWIVMESADGKAVVRLDWDGTEKHWLVSAYEKRAGSGKTSDTATVADRGDTALTESSPDESVGEGESVQQDPARDLFQAVLDGDVSAVAPDLEDGMLDAGLVQKLQDAYAQIAGDADLEALFERAVDALTQAMLKATEGM